MPRHLKTPRILSLLLVMFIVQSCTCWGISIYDHFPSLALSNQSEPETVQTNILPPVGMNCDNLRLTSPLDGLPNGPVTFYWDALPNAASYRINVFGEGAFLAGFEAAGDQTNLNADVSWNAIGGQFVLNVEFVATDANGNTCSKSYVLSREAPQNEDRPESDGPSQPTTTPLPE